MIFKTFDMDDNNDGITTGSSVFWKANKKQAAFNKKQAQKVFDSDKAHLNEINHIYGEVANKQLDFQTAQIMVDNEFSNLSESAKDYGNSLRAQSNALVDGEYDFETATKTIDDYSASMQKTIDANEKAKSGFKGLSVGMVNMFKNIGAELAIALALQLVMKGLQKLDEEFTITKESKLNAMEKAISSYNDKITETSSNIDNLKSIQDEFNTLSKGVDNNGRNIGLSTEEYARYNELVNQIVKTNPELIQGYTAEGNAIINRNNAIKAGIDKQNEYAQTALKTYSTLESGNAIIEGSMVNMNESIDKSREKLEKLGKQLGGNKLSDNSGGSLQAIRAGLEENDIINEVVGYDVKIQRASVDTLRDISDKEAEILAKSQELVASGKMSNEEYAKTESYLSEIKAELSNYDANAQPIVDWLTAALTEASAEGSPIFDSIPESMQASFSEGLRDIATSGTDAATMKVTAQTLADDITKAYNENADGFRDIYDKAEQAREEFLSSDKSKKDAEDANEILTTQADALDELASKYEKTKPELAEFYRDSANDMRDFVDSNEISIKNAVSGLEDFIDAARNAKSEFDAALEGGDYYTGVENYKAIYDEIFNGQNNLGDGSQTFWQGAKQILGTDYLNEVQYDIDAVTSRLREIEPLLQGGAQGADLLGEAFAKAAGGLSLGEAGSIKDEFGEVIATVERLENGAISFDFDNADIHRVADALNISEETLIAMMDSARQFSDIDFTNIDELSTAIKNMAKERDGALKGASGKSYMDYSALATESGIYGPELDDIIGKLNEMGVSVINVNAEADVLKRQFQDIAILQQNGDINLRKTVEQFHQMNMSSEDLVTLLTKVTDIDLTELKKDGFTDIKDYVDEIYASLEEGGEIEISPEVENTKSLNSLRESINTLIETLGGIPPVDIQVNGEEGLEESLDKIKRLSEDDKAAVIDIVAEYNIDGDINTLNTEINDIFGSKDSEKKTKVLEYIVEASGGSLELINGQLSKVNDKAEKIEDVDAELKVDADTSNTNKKLDETKSKAEEVDSTTAEPEIDLDGDKATISQLNTVSSVIDSVPSYKTIHIGIMGVTQALAQIGSIVTAAANIKIPGESEGTPNRRAITSYPSMAQGGKIGPTGNGGPTLTGEIGPELVWLPSQNESFLVGQYGPEVLDLPANAVVYPNDETRRILGSHISRPRSKFGSMAGGTVGGSYTRGYSKSKSSSKSSSSDDNKSAYEKAKAELDHLLEMEYISESTYYKRLQALYNKHLGELQKNVDDQRAALEDLRDAWFDMFNAKKEALEYRLDNGQIDEVKYARELAALGNEITGDKRYIDGNAANGYTDEYEDFLADLNDAYRDAYEAQKDDLDRQLEYGLISYQNYWQKLTNLQNTWLRGMGEDLKEALRDALEEMYDQWDDAIGDMEDVWDDHDLFKSWNVEDPLDQKLKDIAAQRDKINQSAATLLAGTSDAGLRSEIIKERDEALLELARIEAELMNEGYEDQKDNLDEIIDLVRDLVEQEAQERIDALQEASDIYSEMIDKKKESLRLTEDELDFQDQLADKDREIAKIQKQIAALSLDDSRSARAQMAQLQEELDSLIRDKNSIVRDETISKTEEALDNSVDKFNELTDVEVKKIEDFLDNTSEVLHKVYDEIAGRDNNGLLNRLYKYNSVHGDGMKLTVDNFYSDMTSLITKYGSDINKVVEILQKNTDDGKTGGLLPIYPTAAPHHKGLAAGFTGDGADLKQREVYRKLLNNELVLNREDQMRLASQLQILDTIKTSYSKLTKDVAGSVVTNSTPIEIKVESNITVAGSASDDVMKQLDEYGEKLANNTMDKLTEALRRNGVHTATSRNVRKNNN